ncbi:leucine-rich repeat-containing protein 74B-like [Hylaeus volcanicus]|uniref:leucine-rich repeat-containing protein 74B-like n=1 Tax=Hylaeus volcanicus TaxID=313075 RepID=UPI0023B7ADF4|nr:leucine-rich repeat-containing protein 74B-like [Hylaeus volcanicus]
MYPIPDDPGLVPAFWNIRESPTSYPDDGVAKLNDLIKVSKIQPIKSLDDMLLSSEINLQYYGVDPRIIRPLCEALMENTTVQTINLTENWLSEDACYHLTDLLLRNSFVNTLLLSGCRIGAKGVERLQDGISNNTTLIRLDLSNCNIGAEGLDYVATSVCNSSSLESLSLNDNHLDEFCVDALQKLVSCSDTLQQLELSWNSLYTAVTWRKLSKGIENSVALADLDLSWNALGKECVPYLRQLLVRSPTLTKLNLSGNRFYDEDAVVIARGLTRNKVLEELYLGNNPLKVDGAFVLVRAVTPQRSPESQLRVLDLTNIWANKSILKELNAIENGRPWLKVKLGGILSNYEIRGPDVKALLFRRANFEALRPKKKRRRRNFGHFVLSLADDLISRAKFMESVSRFRLKLSKTLVDAIMNEFIGARNTVDQELLKSVYLTLYPDTKLPPEKPKKKKKAKEKGLKRKKKVKD